MRLPMAETLAARAGRRCAPAAEERAWLARGDPREACFVRGPFVVRRMLRAARKTGRVDAPRIHVLACGAGAASVDASRPASFHFARVSLFQP
jgi:hypothetical protein